MAAKKTSETVHFRVESRLLRELGEQLVSEPKIALTELVKNAYDADTSCCAVLYSDSKIHVVDDGHGMTFAEFKARWMSIATSNKVTQKTSRKYGRKLTGSKGIGRFAARFLGSHLTLVSTAFDKESKSMQKLTAVFDWEQLDSVEDITEIEIPVQVEKASGVTTGTVLTISNLRYEISEKDLNSVKNGMMHVTGAISSMVPDDWLTDPIGANSETVDPGFDLVINDVSSQAAAGYSSLADQLVSRFVGKAEITISSKKLGVKVWHSGHSATKPILRKTYPYPNEIGCEVKAVLYWFPRRKGVFKDLDVDGRRAWSWVTENSGVNIFDHGFQISPYGTEDDDWLLLDRDNTRSERHWQSELMLKYFPMSPEVAGSTSLNPMLKLPGNHQILGAALLDSDSVEDSNSQKLIPSMDRQGYVDNAGYESLFQGVRFGVELIAHFDKQIQLEEARKEKEAKAAKTRREIREVVSEIEQAPGLSKTDKKVLIQRYEHLATNVDEIERYDRDARASLETMSLLGVIAGFMTHEYEAALMELERASRELKKAAKTDPRFKEHSSNLNENVRVFSEYIEYTQSFIGSLTRRTSGKYKVKASIKHIVDTFSRLSAEYEFEVDFDDIKATLGGPPVQYAVYQGVVLNLYTNAVKALIEVPSGKRIVRFIAWDDAGYHHLQIMDTGKGIPAVLSQRIWDPLFTTTSKDKGPLGTGMGLGLALVKQVVESNGGQVALVDAPGEYSTCFEVKFPLK